MKKIILTILLCFILIPLWNVNVNSYNRSRIVSYEFMVAKENFPWLTEELLEDIRFYCSYWKDVYELDEFAVCSLIHEESGNFCGNDLDKMKKVVSWAGAIGIMQVMPIHSPNNPNKLKNHKFNLKKGIWYFARCMKKGKGNIKEASRMYNAGLNNKRWKYKNWAYSNRVQKNYQEVTKDLNAYENLLAMGN